MKHVTSNRRLRRKRRTSLNIQGTADVPRISVFRSNKYIYVQAIDDVKRTTLASASQQKKLAKAEEAGIALAKKLLEKGVKQGVFDRAIYAYKGNIKMLAEGMRKGGLKI